MAAFQARGAALGRRAPPKYRKAAGSILARDAALCARDLRCTRAWRCVGGARQEDWAGASGAGVAGSFGGVFGPVLELVLVELAGEVEEAFLQAGLGVEDSFVVDRGTDLFEEEVEELGGGEFAERLGEVLFGVATEGGDGVGAGLFWEGEVGMLVPPASQG